MHELSSLKFVQQRRTKSRNGRFAEKARVDFLEVTSFFQGSNVKTVYNVGDNDAEYPDAEIDDEHTRNALASPLYLQEQEANANLLQVNHSQKRKLVSRCTTNFLKYGETRNAPSVKHGSRCNRVFLLNHGATLKTGCRKSANLVKSPPTVRSRSYLESRKQICSQHQNPRSWDMNTEEIFMEIIRVEETIWITSSRNWAYSNRVWTVQTRTSSASRRIGRSRTNTSCYLY